MHDRLAHWLQADTANGIGMEKDVAPAAPYRQRGTRGTTGAFSQQKWKDTPKYRC